MDLSLWHDARLKVRGSQRWDQLNHGNEVGIGYKAVSEDTARAQEGQGSMNPNNQHRETLRTIRAIQAIQERSKQKNLKLQLRSVVRAAVQARVTNLGAWFQDEAAIVALTESGGNICKAAKRLGIHRNTIINRVHRWVGRNKYLLSIAGVAAGPSTTTPMAAVTGKSRASSVRASPIGHMRKRLSNR
jgi:hypothetical protein